MKDINYFLNIEKEYCKQHGLELISDPETKQLDFPNDHEYKALIEKPFEITYNYYLRTGEGAIENEDKYGLTEVEKIALSLFYGNKSFLFRGDYYHGNIPKWA